MSSFDSKFEKMLAIQSKISIGLAFPVAVRLQFNGRELILKFTPSIARL